MNKGRAKASRRPSTTSDPAHGPAAISRAPWATATRASPARPSWVIGISSMRPLTGGMA